MIRSKTFLFTALFFAGVVVDAAALPPTGRCRAGTLEHVDPAAQALTFRADGETQAKRYVWTKRTRFVRGVSFVESSAAHRGARADVRTHTPFFGEPFVSRVILIPTAPSTRSRR